MRRDRERWDQAAITAQPVSFHEHFLTQFLTNDEIKGKTVLDLGCGPGGLIEPLLARGPQTVMGTDVSHRAIRMCEDRFAGVGNVQFLRADAVGLNGDRQFDLIVSYSVLHLLPLDDDGKFALLRRLLRDGGTVIFDALPRTFYNLVVFALAKNVPFKKRVFATIGPFLNASLPRKYYEELAEAPLQSVKYKYWLDTTRLEALAAKHGFRVIRSEYRKTGTLLSPVKFRCKMKRED